jgi:phosphotriesterase-related protein
VNEQATDTRVGQLDAHVMTVLGPMSTQALGHTQTHEHLLSDLSPIIGRAAVGPVHTHHADPPGSLVDELPASTRGRAGEPIRLDNRDWIARHVLNHDNLSMTDPDLAVAELLRYRDAGGATVVESTSIGLGRDPLGLARISRATGINVIMGAGFYVRDYHPRAVQAAAETELADFLVHEIVHGCRDTGIRPGIIGEIGMSSPAHPDEAKVLRAAVRAQNATGLALQVHPGRDRHAPLDVVRQVEASGGEVSRLVVAHIDRTLTDIADMLELARTGCYLEFDLFGQESSYYAMSDVDRPNDAQRIDALTALAEAGFGDRLVIAQDICQKVYLQRYGGPGYSHILDNVLPVMRRKGWTADDIEQVTVRNPAALLAVLDS